MNEVCLLRHAMATPLRHSQNDCGLRPRQLYHPHPQTSPLKLVLQFGMHTQIFHNWGRHP